jgi:NitT/TauT family transport system substrate-binding protein
MRGCTWKAPLFRLLLLALLLVGSGACAPAPATPTPAVEPAAPGAMAVAAGPTPAPLEKDTLHVAVAATGSAYTPLQVAIEAGYFRNHGLTVNTSVMAASVAAQALVSGSIDMYQGGAAAIAARLGGSDIIYIAAAVDRSTLVLFGEKGLTQFTDFRGKTIATTSVGAFGEIALHQTAKEYGMVPGQDFALLYHPGPEAALASFLAGAAQGVIITPPQTLEAAERGYPVIIDYYQKGLRIIGPGMAVTRAFAREHPNTLKAYLKGYLDGVKRAYDDPEYAMAVNAKYTRVEDPKLHALDYEIGTRTWNKDLTVDRSAIEVVLQNSPLPNAKEANPDDFYDNSLISEVNTTYAAKLFPEVFAGRQSR